MKKSNKFTRREFIESGAAAMYISFPAPEKWEVLESPAFRLSLLVG